MKSAGSKIASQIVFRRPLIVHVDCQTRLGLVMAYTVHGRFWIGTNTKTGQTLYYPQTLIKQSKTVRMRWNDSSPDISITINPRIWWNYRTRPTVFRWLKYDFESMYI